MIWSKYDVNSAHIVKICHSFGKEGVHDMCEIKHHLFFVLQFFFIKKSFYSLGENIEDLNIVPFSPELTHSFG